MLANLISFIDLYLDFKVDSTLSSLWECVSVIISIMIISNKDVYYYCNTAAL